MPFFIVADLLTTLIILYFIINIVRYLFYKESFNGGLFGLSDKWIENEKRRKK